MNQLVAKENIDKIEELKRKRLNWQSRMLPYKSWPPKLVQGIHAIHSALLFLCLLWA